MTNHDPQKQILTHRWNFMVPKICTMKVFFFWLLVRRADDAVQNSHVCTVSTVW